LVCELKIPPKLDALFRELRVFRRNKKAFAVADYMAKSTYRATARKLEAFLEPEVLGLVLGQAAPLQDTLGRGEGAPKVHGRGRDMPQEQGREALGLGRRGPGDR
jgi:hypothetical protein